MILLRHNKQTSVFNNSHQKYKILLYNTHLIIVYYKGSQPLRGFQYICSPCSPYVSRIASLSRSGYIPWETASSTNGRAFHSTYTHSYSPNYIRKPSLLVITYIFNRKYTFHRKLWLLNWSKNQDNHTLVGLAMILPSGLPLIAQSISIYCLSLQWFLSHFLMSLLRYFIFLLYNM
jgi:hypothetical protein